MILILIILLSTFVTMESLAWITHKYLFHGPLWFIHNSHHSKQKKLIEVNDIFSVLGVLIAVSFIVIGIQAKQDILLAIGLGITLYGIFYFVFHDVIVHQRIPFKIQFQHSYLRRIIKAHHIHHKTFTKNDSEAFGFLYAPKKYASKRT
jgi:beta-carotene 3-hydroxylase